MSIHGNQKFFPFLIDSKGYPIGTPADYAIGFKICLDQRKQGEKILNFSRLAWPLIMTQGDPSSHIVFDDVGICSYNLNITNPPRQSTIGHVLRNIDNRGYSDMLDYIKNIILYTEEGKKFKGEKKDEETEEYKETEVAGMLEPKIVQGFGKLWRGLSIAPISQYSLLESIYSVETALNFAESYRNKIDETKGNKIRWKNLLNLIADPFEEWIRDLKAKIKDIELRNRAAIGKEEISITENSVENSLNAEYDQLQQWNLQEKKAILEKVGGLFLPIDQLIIELRKKNKFFLNTESFKTIHVDKAFSMASEQLNFIEEIKGKIGDKVIQLRENLSTLNEYIERIDGNTEEKFESKKEELSKRLNIRNSRIQEIDIEGKKEIEQLQQELEIIEEKFQEIRLIIEDKTKECDRDVGKLLMTGIPNSIIGEGMPVQRLFLSVYAALFEDEEEEERLVFAFPSIVNENLSLSNVEDFSILSKKTSTIMEDDMKIRSNFEFTMEKINLLKTENMDKILKDGFELLVIKGLSNNSISDYYLQEFKKLKIN